MRPTSSIAMTTFNGEKFLREQLDSLAAQTVLPDELVVCDDGSSDGTLEILEAFARTAPFPVRIFRNEKNLGYVANFRKAFFLCEKEVTFFCDQDDIWLPEKLAKTLEVMEREPEVGLVLSYDYRVDEHGKRLPFGCHEDHLTPYLKQENSFRQLFKRRRFGWSAHNLACRTRWREILFGDGFTPDTFDGFIYMTMGFLSHVRVITEPCMYFRRHGGNVTASLKKIKNPLGRLLSAIRNHQSIEKCAYRYVYWHQITDFLKKHDCPQSEEFLYCCGMERFLESRLLILRSVRGRAGRILRETASGRYFRYEKGLRTILSDLLAWPQKMPENVQNLFQK